MSLSLPIGLPRLPNADASADWLLACRSAAARAATALAALLCFVAGRLGMGPNWP